MTRGFMRKEPLNPVRLHEHPEVAAIFTRANWMPFFEKLRGYDEEVTQEFALSLVPHSKTYAIVTFKGITMEITLEFISRVTSFPLGLLWSKEENPLGQVAKKTFFQPNEHPVEEQNGIRRKSISYPWDEVSYQIIKYITCEERYNIAYGYHFRLLHELRYGMDIPTPQKISIPYFLLQSLIDSSIKLKEGGPDQLAHHGLIKLLVEESIHTFTIPIAWEIFKNMTGEDDIKALTYDLSPSESEGEEQKGEDE